MQEYVTLEQSSTQDILADEFLEICGVDKEMGRAFLESVGAHIRYVQEAGGGWACPKPNCVSTI